jgi:hypothetical protein
MVSPRDDFHQFPSQAVRVHVLSGARPAPLMKVNAPAVHDHGNASREAACSEIQQTLMCTRTTPRSWIRCSVIAAISNVLVLGAVPSLQGQSITGALGHISVGPVYSGTDLLQKELSAAGSFGAGMDLRGAGCWRGGGWSAIIDGTAMIGTSVLYYSRETAGPQGEVATRIGGVSVDIGYVVYQNERMIVHPYLRAGSNMFQLSANNRGKEDVRLGDLVLQPDEQVSLTSRGAFADLGCAWKVMVFGSHESCENAGPVVGMEAGAFLLNGSDRWRQQENSAIIDLTPPTTWAFYLRITLGMGIWTHDRDRSDP